MLGLVRLSKRERETLAECAEYVADKLREDAQALVAKDWEQAASLATGAGTILRLADRLRRV